MGDSDIDLKIVELNTKYTNYTQYDSTQKPSKTVKEISEIIQQQKSNNGLKDFIIEENGSIYNTEEMDDNPKLAVNLKDVRRVEIYYGK